MKKNNSSQVVNFGCRLNSYESEIIKTLIYNNNIEDTFVFNTCGVTKEAERQAQQAIRKYKKNYPNKKIIVTGCASQIDPSKFKSMKEVDCIIGNNEKVINSTWKNLENQKNSKLPNIMEVTTTNTNIIEKFDGKARAYVEIQQGCDHRCTFCAIPFGRGNNRSVPIGLIAKRINKLVENGYNEVVLTGVDITDYGKDLPGKPRLSQMIKRILNNEPNLNQLRLSSIDCAEVDNDFWEIFKYEDRLMPHLHISLQAGDDMILKRMKRRHSRKQAIEFCEKAKSIRPDVVFGADLIAGFPTETDSMFNKTCSLITECNLTYLHVFPYSQRESTPASKMPQVPTETKKNRASHLRKIGQEKLIEYLSSSIGKEKTFLVEKNNGDFSIGKTKEFCPIKIRTKLEIGKLFNSKIISYDNNMLVA